MPTEVFAQQMRMVSRNYRVVTLDEMFQHLEDGKPETVLAVTFDRFARTTELQSVFFRSKEM